MTTAILILELAAIVAVLLATRTWEMNLLAEWQDPPSYRLAVVLRFMRPQHWILFSTLFVFVAFPAFSPRLVLVLPAVFFQQAFLFAVNDYFDKDVDALNPLKKKRNVVASGELSPAECRVALLAMFFVGMLFPAFLGVGAAVLSALFMAVSYAYTAPPYRLKGRVFWDLVSHGFVVFSFPFLFTTVAMDQFSLRNLFMYLIFVLLSVQLQVSQEARDFCDDAQVESNSVLNMGYRKAYLLMVALVATGFCLSFVVVLAGWASALFLLVASLCACALWDIYMAWGSGRYDRCFQNIWAGFNRKALVAMAPVVLWWFVFERA